MTDLNEIAARIVRESTAEGKNPAAVMLGRPVEITTRRTVEQSDNWIRREAILAEAQTVYES